MIVSSTFVRRAGFLVAATAALLCGHVSAVEYGPLVPLATGRGAYVISPDFNQRAAVDTDRIKELVALVNRDLGNQLDAVFVVNNQPDDSEVSSIGYYGINYVMHRRAQGLGSSPSDFGAFYGAQTRLRSVMHLPYRSAILNGPSLHEFMHNWANADFVKTSVGGHWGFSSANGQLGGFNAANLRQINGTTYTAKAPNGRCFGTFANRGNSVPFSNLELYLMGLLPESQVEPIQVARNAVFLNNGNCEFTADAIDTSTMAQQVASFGKRFPASDYSQKRFDVLFILIANSTPSASDLADFDRQIEIFTRQSSIEQEFTYNFWSATNGLARMVPVDISKAPAKSTVFTEAQRFLSWAERVFPDFFPAESRQAAKTAEYDYACYPNNICLGLDSRKDIYFFNGRDLSKVAPITDFAQHMRIEGF